MLDELRKLLKHGSVYGLGNILNKAVGFLLIPFYTHYLTTADYGTLELLDLSAALVGLLLNIWMNASLVRYYYEYEDSESRNSLVGTALISTAAIAGIVSITGVLLARPLSVLILKSPEQYRLIWLVSGNLFLTCVNSVSWSYLRAQQRSSLIVSLNAMSLALMLALNIYFIAILRTGFVGILYGGLISNFLVTAGLTVLTVKRVGIRFDPHKLRVLAAFGLPLVLTSFSAFELNFADRFFLQHYTNVSTVGVYALGYKFAFMLSFLILQPFIMIWGARMYQVAKRADAAEAMSRISAYFILLLTAAALLLSLVIKEVIAVVAAPQFRDAYIVTPVVALAYVFYGLAYYFQTGLYVSKRTGYLGFIGVVCAAANIALNFVLIPRYAAMGAAWATAASFLLMAALTYVLAQKVYPLSYAVSRTVLPIAIAVALYALSTSIKVPSVWVSLGIKLLLIVGFPVAIFLLGFFDDLETRQLKRAVRLTFERFGWSTLNSTVR